jgi:pimeloyl-ACP methyl ester carboxylesterase
LALLVTAFCNAGSLAATTEVVDRAISLANGRIIALNCSGRGRFTVLLEPGDGGHRMHMAALFSALSKRYRVCDYDRRNVGHSSSGPVPRKAADLMADAFDVLSAANVKGPYILFGSSMGGLLVRSYAASQNIAGFVTSNSAGHDARMDQARLSRDVACAASYGRGLDGGRQQ